VNKRSGFHIMRKLIVLIKPLTGHLLLAVFLGTLGHLCAIGITLGGGYGLTLALQKLPDYKLILAVLPVIALLRGIFRYGEQTCNHYIAFKLLAHIRDKVFAALRKLSPAKLEGRDKGNLITLITADIELLEVFYAHTVSPVAIAIIVSTLMALLIGSYSPLLALIAITAYIIVGIVIPYFVSRSLKDTAENFRFKAGELSSYVLESLRGIKESIQYQYGEERQRGIAAYTEELSSVERKMKGRTASNMAIANTAILLSDAVMVIAAINLYLQGSLKFQGMVVCILAFMSSFGPVTALASLGSGLKNTLAAGNRVLDLLEEEPLIKDIKGQEEITFKGAGVEAVSFSYDGEEVLRDISLTIEENKITGITGKSGSGKSTLLKLLMRFWEVQKGSVTISGKEIAAVNTDNLRRLESYVTQDTQLFRDSILNNIKLAKLDATREEVEEACKRASVHEFIMKLPKDYNTQVGELGDTLSGGEKQRLGLARAFLHNAPLMLLDEPTSNLDSLNEAVILKSLLTESDGRTVVLVSHRESTMKIADKIYSIANGRSS
jgi:thiol reductant ABC exporter CydC subunit